MGVNVEVHNRLSVKLYVWTKISSCCLAVFCLEKSTGWGNKPVFGVLQQLLHIHFLFHQTAKGRLELGRIFTLQGKAGLDVSRAKVCVYAGLNVVAVCPAVFDELGLCYSCVQLNTKSSKGKFDFKCFHSRKAFEYFSHSFKNLHRQKSINIEAPAYVLLGKTAENIQVFILF